MSFLLLVGCLYLAFKFWKKGSYSQILAGVMGSDEIKDAKSEPIPNSIIAAFLAIMLFTNPTFIMFLIGLYNMIGIMFIACVQAISTIVLYNYCKARSTESMRVLNELIFTKGYSPKRTQPVIRQISKIKSQITFAMSAGILVGLAIYGFSWIPSALQGLSLGSIFSNAFAMLLLFTVIVGFCFFTALKVRLLDSFLVKKYGVEYCFIDGYYKSRTEDTFMNSLHWGIILNMIGSQLFMQFSKSVSHASFMANVSSSALSFIGVYVVMNYYMKNPSKFRFDTMKRSLVFYTCGLNSDNERIKEYFISCGSLQVAGNDPKVISLYDTCVGLYNKMFLDESVMLDNTVNGNIGLSVRNGSIYRDSTTILKVFEEKPNVIQKALGYTKQKIDDMRKE